MSELAAFFESGKPAAALAALGWTGTPIDFNVDFDPRQDLLYEGVAQKPALKAKALRLINAARRKAPREASLLTLEGAVRFAFGEFPQAVAALERAKGGGTWARLWLIRALGYQAMTVKDVGLLDRALELARQLERDEPDCFHLYAWRSELHTGFDLHAEALADLDRALALRPDYGWAHAEKADIYTQQHRLEPALLACNQLIKLHPGEGFAYAIRGRAWGKCGRGREALVDLDRAVKLGPELGAVYSWRGEARRRVGDVDGALSDFDRAVELEPDYPLTYLWRGAAWLAAGRLKEAVADLSRSIKLDPRNALAFAWRGEALLKLGRWEKGLADLDAFYPSSLRGTWTGGPAVLMRELDAWASRGALARALRGRLLLDDKDAGLARPLADLDAAVAALPKHAWCRAWRAQALLRAGRVDEAERDLDFAVRARPGWAWAWAWRGKLKLDAGRAGEARRDFDRALKLDPTLGQVYAWRARSADSRRAFVLGHRGRSMEAAHA